jgi:HTH-type transcriptional repressor of NAD biosynthesis genes
MRRGLVVGKFMPLHRGHQLLIETALAHVDELVVVVYDNFIDDFNSKLMPAQKRANWIAQLYPGIQNVVVLPNPVTADDQDDPKWANAYADQVAFLGPFTHVFSSENYGEPFARAISTSDTNTLAGRKPVECQHVVVDAARQLMPISGTEFRSDMYKYRAYVDPIVYRSLIQKVVFVGTESTGKSTLSKRMADQFGTIATLEYGRTLWEDKASSGITPTFHDFLTVGTTQHEQEEAAVLHSNRFLFCDTNAFITLQWSRMYHGTADARLVDLVERTKDDYIWFLCNNDFGWVDDGTRELKDGKAAEFQKVIERELNVLNPKHVYWDISGPIDRRLASVKDALWLFHNAQIPVL